MPNKKRRRKRRRALRILVVALGAVAVVGAAAGLVGGAIWLAVAHPDKPSSGQSEPAGPPASSAASATLPAATTNEPAETTTTAPARPATTTRREATPGSTTRGSTTAAAVDTQALNQKLDDILAKNGRTPKAIYDYVHGHMTYKSMARGSSYEEMALYAIKYGKGSCYQLTALTYLLLKRAGYDAYYIDGNGWQGGGPHTWVMAYFDGGWYFIDSVYVRSAKLTRADLLRIGYKWDESQYPACT